MLSCTLSLLYIHVLASMALHITQQNCRPYCITPGWSEAAVTGHLWESADVGHSCFWEHRYILSIVQYKIPIDVRKRVKKKEVLLSLCRQWDLPDTSFSYPVELHTQHKTGNLEQVPTNSSNLMQMAALDPTGVLQHREIGSQSNTSSQSSRITPSVPQLTNGPY